jgi:hypothetical protein
VLCEAGQVAVDQRVDPRAGVEPVVGAGRRGQAQQERGAGDERQRQAQRQPGLHGGGHGDFIGPVGPRR